MVAASKVSLASKSCKLLIGDAAQKKIKNAGKNATVVYKSNKKKVLKTKIRLGMIIITLAVYTWDGFRNYIGKKKILKIVTRKDYNSYVGIS